MLRHDRRGFTLVGLLISVIITGLAMIAASDLIKLCFGINEYRYEIIDKSIEQQITALHGIIKNGYMKTPDSTLASGIPATQTANKMILMSSFILFPPCVYCPPA